MAENKKSFTFVWKIKDFSFSLYSSYVYSPTFVADGPDSIALMLILCPNNKDHVTCNLMRLRDLGPDQFILDYELSFLIRDGSVLQSVRVPHRALKKYNIDDMSKLCASREDVFLFKKDLFIPDDTLTICCRLFDIQKSTSLSRCFVETRIGTESISIVGNIKKFSCIEPKGKYSVCTQSSPTEDFRVSMNLSVATDDMLSIEIKPVAAKDIYFRCNIFIQDTLGNKLKVGQDEFRGKNPKFIPLTFSKDYFLKQKDSFVPNDELTICCELIIPVGQDTPTVEYTIDYDSIQGLSLSNTRRTDETSAAHLIENLTILKDDLISLLREHSLCDTKLQTDTETFPTHIAILSARSPVFKTMFTIDMKEKTKNCVCIDDLDADTVRRMLEFMYSATVVDLEHESAKSLYVAADKYNISSLKQLCSSFLKKNLLQSNCCDILLLADTHQDKDLKEAVKDYIAMNDEAVLISDEWKNLEKNHPQLTIEVFRFMHMKTRRN